MQDHGHATKCNLESRANLENFLNISLKENITLMSEIGWINRNQLILTLNNEFYLINLKHQDLTKTLNGIMYGIQQVNMGLFCSLVKKYNQKDKKQHLCLTKPEDIDIEIINQTKTQKT
jgi:hypothetical protein